MSEEFPVEIYDDDELYRRLRLPECIKDIENGVVSSVAFQNYKDSKDVSVDLARLTSPEVTAIDPKVYAVGMIITEVPRSLNQIVFNNPENNNDAHSTIRGDKSRATRKKLARKTKIILYPSNNT